MHRGQIYSTHPQQAFQCTAVDVQTVSIQIRQQCRQFYGRTLDDVMSDLSNGLDFVLSKVIITTNKHAQDLPLIFCRRFHTLRSLRQH